MTRVLLVDLLPYEHSTRTKKVAESVAASGRASVRSVTLDRVGRTGIASQRAEDSFSKGVLISYVHAPEARRGRDLISSLVNLLFVYPVALSRLSVEVLRTPADSIFVGHMSLFWLGILHRRKHGSRVILNARERLGAVRTKGSLGTTFSRIEPIALKTVRGNRHFSVVAVAEGHADEYRAMGMTNVLTVRNVPSRKFVDIYRPPRDTGPLTIALIGSLYDGRGVLPLIEAVGEARRRGANVRLEITGRSNDEFAGRMVSLVESLRLENAVVFRGEVAPDEVAARYQEAHISTALYEAVDAANNSLSNKLFEGPASGRPVLAGNLSENKRVIEEHRIGWTTALTVEDLANSLVRLTAEREVLDQMGRHCFDVCHTTLNWEQESAALVNLLTE